MKLSEALQEFDLALTGNVAGATRVWYQQRMGSLLDALGDVEIEEITISDLRRWRAGLIEQEQRWSEHPTRPPADGPLSTWTVRGFVRAVRRLFAWLVDEGVLIKSPASRLNMPPPPANDPKAVDPDDVLAMLEVADVRDQAIVAFLAGTGCRVGGLADLRLGDLELERCPARATVREKHRGGPSGRPVFLGPATLEMLVAWLEVRPISEHDHVFIGQRGPLTESGIYQVLRRLAWRAGIAGRFNPHAFRHGFARGALDNGADLATVSQLLGHSSVAVTADFYARWSQDELAERHARYSWFDLSLDGK